METNSKQYSAKTARGTNDDTQRRREWVLAAQLSLVCVAIFAVIILLGMWM